MGTKEGIEIFLENYNHLKGMMYYSSDYDALIRLLDFDDALLLSGLTDIELLTLNLVYIKDLKRVDVAELFGVTKQTVQKRVERAVDKLVNYYVLVGEGNET